MDLIDAERPLLGHIERVREMFPSAGTPLLNDIALKIVAPKVAANAAAFGLLPKSMVATVSSLACIERGRLSIDLSAARAFAVPGIDEVSLLNRADAGEAMPLFALRPAMVLRFLYPPRILAAARGLFRLDDLTRASVAVTDRIVRPYECVDLSSWDIGRLAALVRLEPTPEFARALETEVSWSCRSAKKPTRTAGSLMPTEDPG